ncbi:MAG: cation diffusion facilitator family transporter [Planctomycetota bacterium]|jgi:cation diffusion facilitator family transporter
MHNHKIESENRQIRFVTHVGIVCNIVLSAVKVGIGVLVGSIALVADGIHSLSDMATDFAVLLGVHFGSKQPDESHPYGHGRIETFAAGFIALVLTVGGAAMIYYAAMDIARGNIKTARMAVLVVAIISIFSKELLYKITKKVAVKSHSSALYANAWHHRSDALSSIAVLTGFVSLKFGFGYGDQIAAVAVGLMIILVGARVAGDCVRELTESAVDSGTIEHIKEIINASPSIRQWHRLRSRTVGREVFLDLHILVDPELDVATAHEVSESLENAVHEQISRPVNITVHIEPDTPELRKHV